MNKHICSGIILWGAVITAFGLGALNPADANYAAPFQEVVFLLAGGIVTSFIGLVALIVAMDWLPDLSGRPEYKQSVYRLGRGYIRN